ncbi:MAG: hypothetical protein O3A00_05055 [Planctomycetota bacterium]|nr:hypothetical protein [Planctomycetota bacterium]
MAPLGVRGFPGDVGSEVRDHRDIEREFGGIVKAAVNSGGMLLTSRGLLKNRSSETTIE